MDIEEIRAHLDRLDTCLVYILAERMSYIPKVAEYKLQNNLPRYQPEREKQIIDGKRKLAEDLKINPDLVEDLLRRIIQDSHRIEKDIIGE